MTVGKLWRIEHTCMSSLFSELPALVIEVTNCTNVLQRKNLEMINEIKFSIIIHQR